MTRQAGAGSRALVSTVSESARAGRGKKTFYDLSVVGTVGLPAAYGGFETLTEHLTTRLAQRYSVQVFCTTKGRLERQSQYLGADLRYVALDANGWQSIPYDFVSLWKAANQSRTILILGVSGCLLLPLVRLRAPGARIVTNIDGLEWKRRKWGFVARAILRLSEHVAVKFSDVVIVDNQGIWDHVQQTYGRDSCLIAYGGNAEPVGIPVGQPRWSDTRFEPQSYFLSVCRIEPENNVAEFLAAFAEIPSARVVVVGNWTASRYGRHLLTRYATRKNMDLLAPIYDRSRLAILRKGARAYIHGHSAGGTNPSLVEAMWAGMPVLAFDVSYNRYTTNHEAAYWACTAELAHLILTLSVVELAENAQAMREYAWKHFTWEKVASKYETVLFPSTEA